MLLGYQIRLPVRLCRAVLVLVHIHMHMRLQIIVGRM